MSSGSNYLDEVRTALRELAESQKKTDEQIRDMSRRVAELTDGWGLFVEGLVAPSIPKTFARLGYDITRHGVRQKSRVGGRTMEIDVIAAGKRDGAQAVVIAASVKSRLQVEDIKEFIRRLDEFFDFYPEYRGSELLGVVAGIRLDEGVVSHAQAEGLYVIGSSGDAVELLNREGFKPRIWK